MPQQRWDTRHQRHPFVAHNHRLTPAEQCQVHQVTGFREPDRAACRRGHGFGVALLAALSVALIVTTTSVAHPNAPYRTVAWAERTQIDPRPHGQFDTVAADCRGLAPGSKGRYKHFYCVARQKDGERFSLTARDVRAARLRLGVQQPTASRSRRETCRQDAW
jgi:hypothetical protein